MAENFTDGIEKKFEPQHHEIASQRSNWFERNPRKTIVLVVAFFVILTDLILAPFFAERTPNIKDTYYHHDLVANYHGENVWGPKKYIIHTNSLGFKDNKNRSVKLRNHKSRILFVGDSFTEGVGFPYDETFVGLIDRELDKSVFEVLNAGVSSYSPKLYYLKVKYLIENVGLQFNELDVFIDISDIQDEIEYEDFQPSHSYLKASFNWLNFQVKRYSFIGNVLIREIIKIKRSIVIQNINAFPKTQGNGQSKQVSTKKIWVDQNEYLDERGAWTYNDQVFRKWGEKGFLLAEEYIDKLYKLCQEHHIKMTIVVYPWPNEIIKNNINSKNVALWEDFCKNRGIKFVNCYPYFFTGDKPMSIIAKYFEPGDIHFNSNGQKLMAKAWSEHFEASKMPGIKLRPVRH